MFPAILGQALATAALSNNQPTAGKRESVPRQRAELMRFVKQFNRAWTHETDEAVLRGSLHPTVRQGAGRVAMRLDLARAAQIVEWKETDTQLELYNGGQMAIVRYSYELALAQHGHIITRTGRELLVLVREHNRWWIVADAAEDDAGGLAADSSHDAISRVKSGTVPVAAKHHSAPRWIECDYGPLSDACIA